MYVTNSVNKIFDFLNAVKKKRPGVIKLVGWTNFIH